MREGSAGTTFVGRGRSASLKPPQEHQTDDPRYLPGSRRTTGAGGATSAEDRRVLVARTHRAPSNRTRTETEAAERPNELPRHNATGRTAHSMTAVPFRGSCSTRVWAAGLIQKQLTHPNSCGALGVVSSVLRPAEARVRPAPTRKDGPAAPSTHRREAISAPSIHKQAAGADQPAIQACTQYPQDIQERPSAPQQCS